MSTNQVAEIVPNTQRDGTRSSRAGNEILRLICCDAFNHRRRSRRMHGKLRPPDHADWAGFWASKTLFSAVELGSSPNSRGASKRFRTPARAHPRRRS